MMPPADPSTSEPAPSVPEVPLPSPASSPVRRLLAKRRGAAEAPEDPRDWITPEDLNVAPALLGLPLASPWQRAKAMVVDVTLVTMLSNFGNTPLLAGCCWVAWRWYKLQRASRGEVVKEVGWLGWAPALCLVAFGLYSSTMALIDEPTKQARREAVAAASPDRAGKSARAAHADEDGDSADSADAREDLKDLVKHVVATAASAASASASGAMEREIVEQIEKDGELQRKADRVRIKALQEEVRQLKDEARRSPIEKLRHWWEVVGLNLVWAFAYFVAFPLIWPGQTPGKKLMGLRIVELTGKPLKPMLCVRRYGGYAAGATTGGMGFLQILWDANRQGLHDKAAHTAVIDTRNPRRLRLTEDLTG